MHELIATALFILATAALLIASRRLGTFLAVAAFYVLAVAYMKLGFQPGIPKSAFVIYLSLLTVAVLLYITSSASKAAEFWEPLRRTMVEPKRVPVLLVALVAIPAVVAISAYAAGLPNAIPPPKIRSVHPAPPSNITVASPGTTEPVSIDVIAGHNPLRSLPADQLAAKVARGKVVYYENCFYCHGDTLDADGHYVPGVKPPPPASFQDSSVLPMLTESFLFWRVAKGGPGLPEEATPYDSTMPAWEKFLSEDDMWSVILFLYDYTGYVPRSQSALAHEGVADSKPADGHP